MKVFDIEKDGLPDMNDQNLVGRVAFIHDGCIVSGWPLYNIHLEYPERKLPIYGKDAWEANSDVSIVKPFVGVKKYVIFDVPVWDLDTVVESTIDYSTELMPQFTSWIALHEKALESLGTRYYSAEDLYVYQSAEGFPVITIGYLEDHNQHRYEVRYIDQMAMAEYKEVAALNMIEVTEAILKATSYRSNPGDDPRYSKELIHGFDSWTQLYEDALPSLNDKSQVIVAMGGGRHAIRMANVPVHTRQYWRSYVERMALKELLGASSKFSTEELCWIRRGISAIEGTDSVPSDLYNRLTEMIINQRKRECR
jgi:hypothetical protein